MYSQGVRGEDGSRQILDSLMLILSILHLAAEVFEVLARSQPARVQMCDFSMRQASPS